MPLSDKSFGSRFSSENMLREALEAPATLTLPPEYAQAKPNMLNMQADALLAQMARPPQPNLPIPYTNASFSEQAPINTIPFRAGMKVPTAPVPQMSMHELTELMRKNESSGNYTALNKQKKGNTASGAYQYTDSTWNGYGGYSKAMFAPKEVQDRRFREDMQARYMKFGGDPFRVIAAHYLPIAQNNPGAWTQRFYVDKRGRKRPLELSVAEYIQRTLRGTSLQPAFASYLKAHGVQ